MNLYQISTKYENLVNETLEAVGNWWFDQIVLDGSIRFTDPDYKDMEFNAKIIKMSFGIMDDPKTPHPSLRQKFVETLIQEPISQNKNYGGPTHIQDQIGFGLRIDYGVNKEMGLGRALESIGINPEDDPLPYKTGTYFIPGYAYKYPDDKVIYQNKAGLLEVISEITQDVPIKPENWDGKSLTIQTNLKFHPEMKLTNIKGFITCQEIYDYLS